MSHTLWMIYGATGMTGTLIAEEAIHRGHQPLLVGRSALFVDGSTQPSRNGGHVSQKARRAVRELRMPGHGQ